MTEADGAGTTKKKLGCALNGCEEKVNNFMLKCSDCRKNVHYKCSRLPMYQIYLYKSGKRKYICEPCVGDIPADFREQVTDIFNPTELSEDTKYKEDTIAALKEQVVNLEDERNSLVQKNTKLEGTVSSPRRVNEKELLKSLDELLEKRLVNVEERIKNTMINALN